MPVVGLMSIPMDGVTTSQTLGTKDIGPSVSFSIGFSVMPNYLELGVATPIEILVTNFLGSAKDVNLTFEIKNQANGQVILKIEDYTHLEVIDAVVWSFDATVNFALFGEYDVVATVSEYLGTESVSTTTVVKVAFAGNWEAFFAGILALLGFGGVLGVLGVVKKRKDGKPLDCTDPTLTPDQKVACAIT